jgi:DNA helicase-2/ATP-dependent DNA helicase PcrA
MIDSTTFLEILNEVMIRIGRKALSPTQWSAIRVFESDRILQILAGPGSGKTEVLIWRVLYEIFVNEIPASSLLVTTFTNRAATELEIRIVERADEFMSIAHKNNISINDPHIHDVYIGTIHSLCDRLLSEYDPSYVEKGIHLVDEAEIVARLIRNYRWVLGYSTPPHTERAVNRILDNDHLVSLFRPPWVNSDRWPSKNIDKVNFLIQLISQHTETWLPRCGPFDKLNGVESISGTTGLTDDIKKLQIRWEEYLFNENILDFTTIQKYFTGKQNVIHGLIYHVFVDEFQDSNPIQFQLHTNWLRNPQCRITIVGDDDQAIYRFRGSDIRCFSEVQPFSEEENIAYRQEKLEINYRSTKTIIDFGQAFKKQTVLSELSMPKAIQCASDAVTGVPIRLLEGSWHDICQAVAEELSKLGFGRITCETEGNIAESVGILMFSTSERSAERKGWMAPAVIMRHSFESKNIRVYNPRCKTAADKDTPIGMLLGLVSYLIDPVSHAPAGKNRRNVEVWATHKDHADYSLTVPPTFRINDSHISFQKHFRKAGSNRLLDTPTDRRYLLDYIDKIRSNLTSKKLKVRLSLFGFVARLLSFPLFRQSGFTIEMFRQSLFTQLLESNIAPTRLTKSSLDLPLEVSMQGGKYVWADRYWNLLNVFGSYIADTHLDDLEIESFEENAVPLFTFHQSKGTEFDHVYVAGIGRSPDISPALRTALFSGQEIQYNVSNGLPVTKDVNIVNLATADRDRENYVAITRAKKTLTLLHATDRADDFYMQKHHTIETLFANKTCFSHPVVPTVIVREWKL